MQIFHDGPSYHPHRSEVSFQIQWGSNRTNNIDGAESVRMSHNAILVSKMHLATIALLCKQTTDNFRTRNPPEPRWRHLSGNRILFVPHYKHFDLYVSNILQLV